MKTRREFLQASSLVMAGPLPPVPLRAQELPERVRHVPKPSPVRDYWNDLPNYLTSVIDAARTRRKSELSKIKTRKEADERASFVRAKVWDLIGGPLEKAPYEVKTTGVIE